MTVSESTSAPRVGIVFRPEFDPRQLREFVGRAEGAGLDDVWVWEDCFFAGGVTAATAAAASTQSIRIGLGLIPAPFRNVAVAAMELATMQNVMPGRVVPGVGHGVRRWLQQTGALPQSQMTQLREWVSALRALLHGGEVSTQGQYVHLDAVRLNWPPTPPPPVLVGARGPRTLALAGELADGVILDAGLTPAGLREARAATGSTGPFETVFYLPCGAADRAASLEADLDPKRGAGPERLAVGTATQIAQRIHEFATAGATCVALQPAVDDPEPFATLELAAAARQLLLST